MNPGRILTVIALILFALPSHCQKAEKHTWTEVMKGEIDSIINTTVSADRIPGAVILIKKDGKEVCRKAYGYAMKYEYDHMLAANPEKMTPDHLFDIASLTKVVGTTTSIMLLTDRGALNVDDPVCKYIKAFDTPEKRIITIRHLLTHTAGLYEWYPLYYLASDKHECYKLIGLLPLKYPPGEKRHYSDLGFVILGQIIETVSGQPLEEFMDKNIFVPLGMTNTTFNPLKSGRFTNIAATSPGNPYEKRMVSDTTLGFTVEGIEPAGWNGWRTYLLRGEVNDGNAWYANGGVSGAAGLFSTADDIQKLVDMLLCKGMNGSERFIDDKTIGLFLTRDQYNNGLGWMMDTTSSFMRDAPDGSFGHTGFTGTSIAVVPDRGLSVILLINRQNTGLQPDGGYFNVSPLRQQIFTTVMKYL